LFFYVASHYDKRFVSRLYYPNIDSADLSQTDMSEFTGAIFPTRLLVLVTAFIVGAFFAGKCGEDAIIQTHRIKCFPVHSCKLSKEIYTHTTDFKAVALKRISPCTALVD